MSLDARKDYGAATDDFLAALTLARFSLGREMSNNLHLFRGPEAALSKGDMHAVLYGGTLRHE